MTELHGKAFVNGRFEEGVTIVIDGEQIADVHAGDPKGAHAPLIIPGLIDLHVHGGAGFDFMDATGEAVSRIRRFHAANGTTALAGTTLSGTTARINDALAAIHAGRREDDGADIAGVHLEGPYINSEKRGAQDAASVRAADPAEFAQWIAHAGDMPVIATVAPEVEGVLSLIELFHHRVTFSIGHTNASYPLAIDAVNRGARHFTHLLNAMTPIHHRNPGVVGAAVVSTEATAELIADGVHIHPVMLRLFACTLGSRAVLVTDAMRACGMADGRSRLYDYDVTVSDGAARLDDGTLAGSVLTMSGAVRNMVELAGLPLEQVVPMATETPARILGIGNRKGKIAAGYDADLVILSERLEVEQVLVRGRRVTAA